MAFYDKFEELCRAKGVTPTGAARENGLAQSVISMWKTRGSTPQAATVQKLADYFGVPVSSLLYDGTIDLHLDGVKNPKDMTPEELKEFIANMPKAFEEIKKAAEDTADAMLDYHADGDVLLLQYYNMLNHKGRKEAIKRTAELSRQEEYTTPDNPKTPK